MKKVHAVVKELSDNLIDLDFESTIINVRSVLKQQLINEGYQLHRADEISEEWTARLEQEIHGKLEEWDALGIPRPLIHGISPATLLTYKHKKYLSQHENKKLPIHFPEVLNFIKELSTRDFLLVPILLMFILKSNPIFVTDGANDGGVDCMGVIKQGPLRSLCIFIQSKAGPTCRVLGKDVLRQEISKFQELQGQIQFISYLTALGNKFSIDGQALCYGIVCNSEFNKVAREYALQEKILLRSSRQSAYWISQYFQISDLIRIKGLVSPVLGRNLNQNLVPLIESALVY